jgi:hypothetical protein
VLRDAFGDECWSRVCTFKWFKWFKDGRTSNDDGPQSQLPSTTVEGNVHQEYVSEGQTVNHLYYIEVLKGLRHAVYCKRPKKQKSRAWAVHCDNAPAHTQITHFMFCLANWVIPVVQQPPCSPGMASCDFWLFLQTWSGTKREEIWLRHLLGEYDKQHE